MMVIVFRVSLFLFCCFCACINAIAGPLEKLESLSTVEEKCQLTFGWTEWMPLQYLNEQSKPQGIQIELVKAIAQEMDCELVFVKANWNELIEGVKQGRIDFISDATYSEERAEFANFSDPYRRDSFVIYVLSQDHSRFKQSTVEQLKSSDMRLAFTSNFLYGDDIEAWQKDNTSNKFLSYAKNTEINIERLFDGKIDGFLEDPYVLSYKIGRKKIPRKITKLPIIIIGHTACYMFSKKTVSIAIIKRFNRALEKAKQHRRFQTNWFRLD